MNPKGAKGQNRSKYKKRLDQIDVMLELLRPSDNVQCSEYMRAFVNGMLLAKHIFEGKTGFPEYIKREVKDNGEHSCGFEFET